MGVYEKIFFLVFEVSGTNWYLYQIFDYRYWFLIQRRSGLRGDILIILFWGKVTDMNKFKYTYLLKYLHVGQIFFVLEINICNQIFGINTSLSQKHQKLKKKFLIDAHYKTWAVFSDITKNWKYFLFFTQREFAGKFTTE